MILNQRGKVAAFAQLPLEISVKHFLKNHKIFHRYICSNAAAQL